VPEIARMARLFSGLSSKDGDVPEIARMARLFSGLSSKDGDVPEIARMARLFSGLSLSSPEIKRTSCPQTKNRILSNVHNYPP
jgi:tetrahydromethanopterin S-methyltransferase subunit F